MADWRAVVGAVAPTLATALGGPLAGAAVSALSSAVLGRPDGKEQDVAAAVLHGGDEVLLQIRQAELAFQTRMRELDIDLERVHQADRASARLRETGSGDNWTPRVLAGVIVAGFLGTVYYVLSGRVEGLKDPMVAGLVGTLIGYVSAKADQVISYYFGSSAGSKEKTALINRKPGA